MTLRPLALLASLFLAALPARALAPAAAPADARLREQNKTLTNQLRTAQTEAVTLKEEKLALEDRIKKLEEAAKNLAAEMAAAKKTAATEADALRADIERTTAELTATKDLHLKAATASETNAARASKLEGERNKLVVDNGVLQGIVTTQQIRNVRMLETSREVLNRYEKFGLGTALTAREPFVGITRARLESMVEDYSSQLAAHAITTKPVPPAPGTKGKGAKPSAKPSAKPAAKPTADRPSDGPAAPPKPAAAKP